AAVERLDAHEFFHWAADRWKPLAAGLVVLLAAGYALSGLTQVEANEVAVVRRFGRPLEHDLEPGLHWCWPWPVEQVTRRPADETSPSAAGFRSARLLEIGFRSDPKAAAVPSGGDWASSHAEGVRRVPDEGLM